MVALEEVNSGQIENLDRVIPGHAEGSRAFASR